PLWQPLSRGHDLAVRFAASNGVGRRRTHHHAFHHGLAADDEVALHGEDSVEKFEFSARSRFHTVQLTVGVPLSLPFCCRRPVVSVKTLKCPLLSRYAFFTVERSSIPCWR